MTAKHDRAEAGRQLARTEITRVLQLEGAGHTHAAEEAAVHAYHGGAKALDLLRQYHEQRTAQETSA